MAAPIPPQWLDEIEAVHFATGVPRSWIAAVCDRSGWNPNYIEYDIGPGGPTTIRRFGLAGIWAHAPTVDSRFCKSTPLGPDCWAGWFHPGTVFQDMSCTITGVGQVFQGSIPTYQPVAANLLLAAKILNDCALTIQGLCGEVNALAFLRWQWGCRFVPIDPITGDPVCTYPPGTPNIFVQEIDDIIAAQKVYADQFGEPYFGAPPLTISISANQLTVGVGQAASFIANVQGGKPAYTYQWNFGDGTPVVETTNTSVSHAYDDIGVYPVACRVIDSLGDYADSSPLPITVEVEPVAGTSNMWLWALLAAGAAGVLAVVAGKKDKRQQAQQLRQKAQALRAEANRLRGQGRNAEADRLDQQAGQLEDQATRLEQEAAREDVERAQRQQQQRR